MTKLELQNKIAVLEQNISKTKNPNVLAIFQKNLEDAKQKLAALEQGTPAPDPSGGSSKLEELYAQRERFKKGLNSNNPVVQKASKMSLKKVEDLIAELEGAAPKPATPPARPAERKPRMESPKPEEVPATKTPTFPSPARRGRPSKMETPAPTPAKRGRPSKMETPAPTPARRGRPSKMETPAEEKPKIRRGRKPKAETPAEVPAAPVRRGRKPKAPTETPAKAPAKRGRPALPKGAKSQEVSIDSLTKLANALVEFCIENGISNPSVSDLQGILNLLDKGKALKFAKGGKISKSGSYLSKWQIKQILTDGGMKIGSDELLSGVWLKKKDSGVAQMRMGGEVGYFVIDDDILDSGKPVMLGNRRISAKNKKFQGVFMGKMVGGLMKVYDYDDEMWKVVNPDEWQQAYAEGGEVGFTEQFTQVEDFGYESFYIRKWGKVETNKKEVELLVVASIRDLEDFISEDEMPEEGSFQLDITLIPFEKHISKKHKTRANDESNAISNNTLVNVVNYMGGLNYNPQEQFIFKTFDEAQNYLMSKELNDKISAEAMLSGFFMDRPYNRVGQTNWEMLEYIVGERQRFAKGGGVYTSDKIFVLEVRDGETNELLEEKVYRANRYSTALLDAEYDEDLFKKKYGDYLHFKLKEKYAEGGGVGGFSSKEYDKPREKTIYDVEVENEDDDAIILEKYDNYDEAISAYQRSKYRFPIRWRTYLETQKAPFVYEGGIVLTDGTLAVQYRKGKEVKHDFNGNEI